ncbi:hypothetical protein Moror_10284 [Moniliophthora roreri MCA 2997]|uniref:BTB domain-containing protein n=1 Tax=Moniliophthora roreri (strain MCA 2997) TaxID=1381753 RepID=V2XEJ3_MONRO|nr:hypothetical protein Moror_10284 [Moniliophthora roreri MCA 2997]
MKWNADTPSDAEDLKPSKKCTPNQHFFLQPVVFQVDDELFQIPDTVFPASEKFQELHPAILEGNGPVVLGDCTKEQFGAFLTVILQPYSRMFPETHPCNLPNSLETLIPALDLATNWGFRQLAEDISAQAGQFIQSAVQKVALGRKYTLPSWYRPGLEELVQSEEDITLEEAEEIGLAFTIRIYHARTRYAREMRDIAGDSRTEASITAEIIEHRFADELAKFPALVPLEPQVDTPEQPNQFTTQSSFHEDSEVETVIATEDAMPEDLNLDVSGIATTQVAVPTEYSLHVGAQISPSPVNEPVPATGVIASSSSSPTQQPAPPVYEYPASIDIQRLVVRAIINSRLRENVTILGKVPIVCHQGESRCGSSRRCRACCVKEAKRYHELGWMPQPKDDFARVVLDMTVWSPGTEGQGFPSSSREVLQHVPKACERKEKQCGMTKRCLECCLNKFEELLKHGKVI